MNKLKIIAGIILFGSLWGFSEVIIGSAINEAGLPSGAIMTGLFAMIFLVMSRMFYRQTGIQFGMGLVAGTLRMFNPFIGCHLCSAIAIMAEAAIFEILWYKISSNFKELKDLIIQGGMGIITAYTIFISGYIITQILTPIVAGATFYIENLIVFMPRILATGLLPAVLGGIVLPMILVVKEVNFTVKDRLYYPITIVITILCWFVVAGNWIIFS